MMHQTISAAEKRKTFKEKLKQNKLLKFPGAFSPIVAKIVEKLSFDGIYISGGALSADLGFPDIGLTTMTEVTQRGHQIIKQSSLPSIIDIDTGFGEALNAARTIFELEELGFTACHIEDQHIIKRCGHLDNKTLISKNEAVNKIKSATNAIRDPNFTLIARTDAKASEGMDAAIDRAKAYVDAGASMIFPEALNNEKEFEQFRKAIHVPLLANMTEFGKSPILSDEQLQNLGYNVVIYPVTTLRLALKAIEDGLSQILKEGSQQNCLGQMMHRADLYELLNYDAYQKYDQNVFNFNVKKGN